MSAAATMRLLRISPVAAIASSQRGETSRSTPAPGRCVRARRTRDRETAMTCSRCTGSSMTSQTVVWRCRRSRRLVCAPSMSPAPALAAMPSSRSVTFDNADTTTIGPRASPPSCCASACRCARTMAISRSMARLIGHRRAAEFHHDHSVDRRRPGSGTRDSVADRRSHGSAGSSRSRSMAAGPQRLNRIIRQRPSAPHSGSPRRRRRARCCVRARRTSCAITWQARTRPT